ncbi:serine palmitoyltransferase component [Boothiomyces sp. JEL0866]|nr:serine palmitoyltransferase component [Boothiomyces sp. JEL0866]
MGRGQRAHKNFKDPKNSFDTLASKEELLEPPALYTTPKKPQVTEDSIPLIHLITTYLSYFILIVVGHVKDFIVKWTNPEAVKHLYPQNGLAPITTGFDTFYHRNLYMRIRDSFFRTVTGVAGGRVTVYERYSEDFNKTFKYTGELRSLLNLSSYNYLGFGENNGKCTDYVEAMVKERGISTCSSRSEVGTSDLHMETEQLVASFLGQEAAIITSMGFATNSTVIPALIGKGCLIISDELNHSSIVFGSRTSGATIKVFKHNDPVDLELVLRDAISQGQPRTHRPWKKILVIVEGLYSMEGDICKLPEIIDLKEKYKFYLYLDEAHSVGAMGPNGKGVCDYYGIDPSLVDILMGTFTKSFGAAGGYIAGRKSLIDFLRLHSYSAVYAESISVPVIKQIFSSLRIIMGLEMGNEGRERIQKLARNSKYFADGLRKLGFIVYGNDSPIVPLLLLNPAKMPAFSREMLKRGIAVVIVGYPATAIITSRVRFCISSAHSLDDLDWALSQISEVGDRLLLKMGSKE